MSLKSADADVTLAKFAVSPTGNPTNDEALISLSAYHTQQAIEKLLKYVLHDLNGVDNTTKKFKTHKIYDLILMLDDYDFEVPQRVKEKAITLTDWEAQSRYNDNMIATKNEITECLDIYQELKAKIIEYENIKKQN